MNFIRKNCQLVFLKKINVSHNDTNKEKLFEIYEGYVFLFFFNYH